MSVLSELKKRDLEHKQEIEKIRQAYLAEEVDAAKSLVMEKKLWETFASENKGEKFIKLEHIDRLGLEYDVLFVTTVKNTGKTTNIIYNRFKHYAQKGQKVIFGRLSPKELKESLPEYGASKANPFLAKTQNGIITLFSKETGEETGRCVDFKFCNSISAGEFEGYGAILFDEVLSWDPKNMIGEGHINNFFAFPSSIQRNKKEKIKVYLCSNLPSTKKNNLLLEMLGIDLNDKLRYIVRKNPDNPNVSCKILYLNAGALYRGIMDQDGAAQMASQTAKALLNSNRILDSHVNAINTDLFKLLKSKFNFIINIKDTIVHFELRESVVDRYSDMPVLYALKVRMYDPCYYSEGIIYTECAFLAGKYGNYVQKITTLDGFIGFIGGAVKANTIKFVDSTSLNIAYELFKINEKKNEYLW